MAGRRGSGQSCDLHRSFQGLGTEPRLPGRRPRRLSILKPYGESVHEHETGYVVGIGARIKPANQTTIRMGDKHVGARHASGSQQGTQIGDRSPRRGRLRSRSLRLGSSPTGVPGRS